MFDDAEKGLKEEPFVAGMSEMIDKVVEPGRKFVITFSDEPFLGWEYLLEWAGDDAGGNWYNCQQLNAKGWLCPALYHYFVSAPKSIFVMIGYEIEEQMQFFDEKEEVMGP